MNYEFDKEYIINLDNKEYSENQIFIKLIKSKIVILLSKEYKKIKGLEESEEGRELNNILKKKRNNK